MLLYNEDFKCDVDLDYIMSQKFNCVHNFVLLYLIQCLIKIYRLKYCNFSSVQGEGKNVRKSGIYVEEPENHWGVKTSLNSVCRICKLPLTSHLSPSVGGVTVYHCGEFEISF